jgi:hypothetical protein
MQSLSTKAGSDSMIQAFRLMAVLAAFTVSLGVWRPVAGGEFNDRQKAEIGEIAREYLLKNPEILSEVFQARQATTGERSSPQRRANRQERQRAVSFKT